MLLHRVPPTTEERRSSGLQGVEDVHELPELPEGVVAPDDLSGLEPPTARAGLRWLRWVAVLAVAVIAVAVWLLVRAGGDPEQAEPTVVMSPAAQIIQDEIDAAITQLAEPTVVMSPAAQIIQDEIDHAINEHVVLNEILAFYENLAAPTR